LVIDEQCVVQLLLHQLQSYRVERHVGHDFIDGQKLFLPIIQIK